MHILHMMRVKLGTEKQAKVVLFFFRNPIRTTTDGYSSTSHRTHHGINDQSSSVTSPPSRFLAPEASFEPFISSWP